MAAALVHRAIGDQLTCVFVDTGLMRTGEAEQVEETFRRQFHMDLVHVKAADRFFGVLEGVTEPEAKRKAIGETFIRVFEEVAAEVEDVRFLVQGTLYPDIIESGTGRGHHQVASQRRWPSPGHGVRLGGAPAPAVQGRGTRRRRGGLGLPEEIVWRQPFPGPGLGGRIIGEVTPERAGFCGRGCHRGRRGPPGRAVPPAVAELRVVLPAVRTVGVMGDERTYAYPVVIRAVTSDDAMTVDWARLPYELLERLSSRIINEVDGVNRVALDITSKPPGTIEWE